MVLQRESHVASGVFSLSVSARITEVLDFLRDKNQVEYVVISENDDVAENGLNWGDVLILSKHSSAKALELVSKAKKKGVLVIYDIDDWIFSFPAYSGGGRQSENRDNMYSMIDEADYVTAANKTILSEILKRRHDAVLVPNGMYVDKYIETSSFIDKVECVPPRIIFTNADLLKISNSKETFVNVLHEFFRKRPEYIMDFFGDPFPEMFSMSFLHFSHRMTYQDYMIALINGKYQFSITPLGGSEDADSWFFNSCKNPFKYLNYGAACVPGIYSNSPIYQDTVENHETGILVENSKSSWLDSLELMADDSALRQRIRGNAFWDVVENHHIKDSANKLVELFQ